MNPRHLAALTAALVALSPLPALAAPAPDLPGVPGKVMEDLTASEESRLAGLTGSGPEEVAYATREGGRLVVRSLPAKSVQAAGAAAALLDAQPSVVASSPAGTVSVLADYRSAQWGVDRLGGDPVRSGLDLSRVTVAVVDTGIDGAHPDFSGVLVPGVDLVDGRGGDANGHGTHVAGIVGADADGDGVTGFAAGARLMPVRVLDGNGSGSTTNVARGVVWAADHGANVVNLSLGGPTADAVLAEAIAYARSRGVVVVAAAGNSATEGNPVIYPAAFPGVIGVGATDPSDRRGSFSSHGSWVDVAAPGVKIASAVPGGYGYMSGTSMAAPFVAAEAALLFAASEKVRASDVEELVPGRVQDLGAPGRDDEYGTGIVYPSAAINAAKGRYAAAPDPEPAPEPAPAPSTEPTLAASLRGVPGTLTAPATVTVDVTTNGTVTGLRWLVDDREVLSGPDAKSYVLDPASLGPGDHVVLVEVTTDTAGTGVVEAMFNVPTTDPAATAKITFPTVVTKKTTAKLLLTYSKPIRSIAWFVDGKKVSESAAATSYVLDPARLTSGAHRLEVRVALDGGPTATSYVTFDVKLPSRQHTVKLRRAGPWKSTVFAATVMRPGAKAVSTVVYVDGRRVASSKSSFARVRLPRLAKGRHRVTAVTTDQTGAVTTTTRFLRA